MDKEALWTADSVCCHSKVIQIKKQYLINGDQIYGLPHLVNNEINTFILSIFFLAIAFPDNFSQYIPNAEEW